MGFEIRATTAAARLTMTELLLKRKSYLANKRLLGKLQRVTMLTCVRPGPAGWGTKLDVLSELMLLSLASGIKIAVTKLQITMLRMLEITITPKSG